MPYVTNMEHIKQAVDKVDPLKFLAEGAPPDEYTPPIEELVMWARLDFTIHRLGDFFWEYFEAMPPDDALEELRDRIVHGSGWHLVT